MYKRGKRENLTSITTRDIFNVAKKNYGFSLEYKDFSKLLNIINNHIFNIALYDNDEYRFPKKLGTFRVKRTQFKLKLDENNKVKTNQMHINFKASKELWSKKYPNKTWQEIKKISNKPNVYYLNKHTNGAYNQFYWDKRTSTLKNQIFYKLVIVRSRKKELAELSRQNKIYYE